VKEINIHTWIQRKFSSIHESYKELITHGAYDVENKNLQHESYAEQHGKATAQRNLGRSATGDKFDKINLNELGTDTPHLGATFNKT
jgi:hypothetical protein